MSDSPPAASASPPARRSRWGWWLLGIVAGLGLLLGAALGFYDGFFGPGMGSLLLFAFVGVFGYDFIAASASAKLVNVATNLAGLAYFVATDQVLYHVALPMAVCNVLGSTLGARMALRRGTSFVRVLFLLIVGAFILKLGWELLRT